MEELGSDDDAPSILFASRVAKAGWIAEIGQMAFPKSSDSPLGAGGESRNLGKAFCQSLYSECESGWRERRSSEF